MDKSTPGGLGSALAAVRGKAGRPLRVDIVRDSLDDVSRTEFDAMLVDLSLPPDIIEAALKAHAEVAGTEWVGSGAIRKWRRDNGVT